MQQMDFQKVKEEGKALKKEVRERTLGFITGGLGLVAGLAWNDAIKALIDYHVALFNLQRVSGTLLDKNNVIIQENLTPELKQ